jgi:hypothetical protein
MLTSGAVAHRSNPQSDNHWGYHRVISQFIYMALHAGQVLQSFRNKEQYYVF